MSDAPVPEFAQSLAFRLSQIGARSAQLFAAELHDLGVSPRAFGVLGHLQATGTRTQQELADALDIHRNNMVGLIDELEASGWVRRHRSKVDRRAFDVRLTDAGTAIVARVSGLLPRLDELVGRDLSAEQRQVLSDGLDQIALGLGLIPGVHPSMATRAPRPRTETSPPVESGPSRESRPGAEALNQ